MTCSFSGFGFGLKFDILFRKKTNKFVFLHYTKLNFDPKRKEIQKTTKKRKPEGSSLVVYYSRAQVVFNTIAGTSKKYQPCLENKQVTNLHISEIEFDYVDS